MSIHQLNFTHTFFTTKKLLKLSILIFKSRSLNLLSFSAPARFATQKWRIRPGKNSLCAWIVCVTLYLMFISFLCTLLLCQCVCMFVMSMFSSSFIYSIISVKLCSIKFLLKKILKVFHCFHYERLQFTLIHLRIACLFLMTLSLFRSIETCKINYKGLPII